MFLNMETTLLEISSGMQLQKCRQCGCMQETVLQLEAILPGLPAEAVSSLGEHLPAWKLQMNSVQYSCLGCDHCFAGAAQNALIDAFPQVTGNLGLSCELQSSPAGWPPVVGEYQVLDAAGWAAVVTLASVDLVQELAMLVPKGLAIVGKLETENIGIDKLIKNVIANPGLRYLVLAGSESIGHQSGQALLMIKQHGVDEKGRIIGAAGKRPVLRNVTGLEINAFRNQVELIDLIGCQDATRIAATISQLNANISTLDLFQPEPCGCSGDT